MTLTRDRDRKWEQIDNQGGTLWASSEGRVCRNALRPASGCPGSRTCHPQGHLSWRPHHFRRISLAPGQDSFDFGWKNVARGTKCRGLSHFLRRFSWCRCIVKSCAARVYNAVVEPRANRDSAGRALAVGSWANGNLRRQTRNLGQTLDVHTYVHYNNCCSLIISYAKGDVNMSMADFDKETQLVLALAAGASVASAARKTGCSARTLFRRLEDDAFRRQVARARTQLVMRATSMLAQTSIRAVATLRKLLDDENPSVKRMAARGVLDALARLSGQGEIEERVAELETVVLGDVNREYQEPSERLQIAGKAWIRQKRQERAAEAERLAFHQQCIAAGIQPLDERGNLAYGDWDKYCEFYGLDYDRERHDMPCDSWRFKSPVDHMPQIWYWYSEMRARRDDARGVSPPRVGLRRAAGGGWFVVQRRVGGCPVELSLPRCYHVSLSPTMAWQPTTFRRFIRGFPSSARTALVETDAGQAYLKGMGGPEGPHTLASEWVATQLASWLGLSTFDFAILQLGDEDEVPLVDRDGNRIGKAAPGPAFVTREESGETWSGGIRQLKKLVNPHDVASLVVFDTWLLNCDRYSIPAKNPLGKHRINRNNVFLSEEAPAGQLLLKAMDHTHCFTCGAEWTKALAHVDRIQCRQLFGMFPEFRKFIGNDRGGVRRVLPRN